MHFIESKSRGNFLSHSLSVACQHHSFHHALGLESSHCRSGLRFHGVRNNDVSGILPVLGHMDYRARLLGFRGIDTGAEHQLGIAHIDRMAANVRPQPFTGKVLHTGHF